MVRGQGSGLNKARLLDVELSSICSRNRYTTDPAPVIAELRARAGKRTDVLAHATGIFAGYFDDEHTHTLCAALRADIDGIGPWVQVGAGTARPRPTPHPVTANEASGSLTLIETRGLAMNALTNKRNPAATGLTIVGVVALVVAFILAGAAASAAGSYYADVALVAALNRWSDLMLYVAVAAIIGVVVLIGVRWLFNIPPAAPAPTPAADHTAADGR